MLQHLRRISFSSQCLWCWWNLRASWSFQWSRPKRPMAVPEVSLKCHPPWGQQISKIGVAKIMAKIHDVSVTPNSDLTWLVEQGWTNLWSVVCWKNGHVGWHCFTLLNSPFLLTHPGFHSHILQVFHIAFFGHVPSFGWLCLQDVFCGFVWKSRNTGNHRWITRKSLWTWPNHKQLISCIPFYPMISHEITIFNVFFGVF